MLSWKEANLWVNNFWKFIIASRSKVRFQFDWYTVTFNVSTFFLSGPLSGFIYVVKSIAISQMILCLFQVEMLYQRYFLRTNQNHMTHLLWLLLILSLILGVVQLTSHVSPKTSGCILLGSSIVYAGKYKYTELAIFLLKNKYFTENSWLFFCI